MLKPSYELISSETESSEGGFAWIILISSFILHVLADGICYAFGVFTPELVSYYNTDRQMVGWLNSIRVGISLLVGPVAGKWSITLGYRTTTILGAVIGSLGLVGPFFCSNFTFLFISIAIVGGFGQGLLFLPSICIVTTYFCKQRSLAVGFVVCGSGVGTFLFGPLINFLLNKYSWRGAILVLSGILLNCAVCASFYRPRSSSASNCSNAATKSVTIEKSENSRVPYLAKNNSNQIIGWPQIEAKRRNVNIMRDNEIKLTGIASEPVHLADNLAIESNERERNFHLKQDNTSHTSGLWTYKDQFTFSGIFNEIVQFFNPYLLKNPIFMLFAISNFFTSLGFNAPFLFAVDRAILMGIREDKASLLVSCIGAGNTIGRLVFGAMGTCGKLEFHIHLYNISLIICGLVIIASWYAQTFPLMIIYTCGFGLFSGTYVSLTPIVLVGILDLKSLNDSFGLICLFMGIAVFIGAPMTGWIFDYFHSYDYAFAFCGIVILISGIIVYPILCLRVKNP